jgi:hypothetical protein
MSPFPLFLFNPIPTALPTLPDDRPLLTIILEVSPLECPPCSHQRVRTITPTAIATSESLALKWIIKLTHPTQI